MREPGETIGTALVSRVTVRMADARDGPTLERLAALDSAAMPVGPTLVGEIDGEAVAALPVAGGAAVADPFRRTSAAIELLELRAAQLRRHAGAATTPGSYARRLRALIRAPHASPLR